ncbi:hypothetical protein GJ744_001168 [Endocarpon pusillum]|uniref:Uncharacterized protein n=1 Tax=Endocarpon pusillum TaxID=364733 RepID=A0A8H7AAG3_9EURO|nr:hypothetical protein GJ744_001168 [Endocarpon pusillum]
METRQALESGKLVAEQQDSTLHGRPRNKDAFKKGGFGYTAAQTPCDLKHCADGVVEKVNPDNPAHNSKLGESEVEGSLPAWDTEKLWYSHGRTLPGSSVRPSTFNRSQQPTDAELGKGKGVNEWLEGHAYQETITYGSVVKYKTGQWAKLRSVL